MQDLALSSTTQFLAWLLHLSPHTLRLGHLSGTKFIYMFATRAMRAQATGG